MTLNLKRTNLAPVQIKFSISHQWGNCKNFQLFTPWYPRTQGWAGATGKWRIVHWHHPAPGCSLPSTDTSRTGWATGQCFSSFWRDRHQWKQGAWVSMSAANPGERFWKASEAFWLAGKSEILPTDPSTSQAKTCCHQNYLFDVFHSSTRKWVTQKTRLRRRKNRKGCWCGLTITSVDGPCFRSFHLCLRPPWRNYAHLF